MLTGIQRSAKCIHSGSFFDGESVLKVASREKGDESTTFTQPGHVDFTQHCGAERRRRKGNKLRPLRQVEREGEAEDEDEFLLCVVAWERLWRKRANTDDVRVRT